MKKEFKPELIELAIAETSDSLSGVDTTPKPPKEEEKKEWNIQCEFRNHNSGSHSEVAVTMHNYGTRSGDVVEAKFATGDFKLAYVKDAGGVQFSNVTETGFTIKRYGHFNPGENIEFIVQLTCTKDGKVGAYGTTGQFIACPIKMIDYTVS